MRALPATGVGPRATIASRPRTDAPPAPHRRSTVHVGGGADDSISELENRRADVAVEGLDSGTMTLVDNVTV